jgi:hypothetical protein
LEEQLPAAQSLPGLSLETPARDQPIEICTNDVAAALAKTATDSAGQPTDGKPLQVHMSSSASPSIQVAGKAGTTLRPATANITAALPSESAQQPPFAMGTTPVPPGTSQPMNKAFFSPTVPSFSGGTNFLSSPKSHLSTSTGDAPSNTGTQITSDKNPPSNSQASNPPSNNPSVNSLPSSSSISGVQNAPQQGAAGAAQNANPAALQPPTSANISAPGLSTMTPATYGLKSGNIAATNSSDSLASASSSPAAASELPSSAASATASAPAVNPVQLSQMLNKAAQSEMRIGMTTSAFGGVEVRAVVHANEVGVQIGSEKGDLRSLLANELPGIADRLQQQNLRLAQVNFHQGFASSNHLGSGGGSQPQSFPSKSSGSKSNSIRTLSNETANAAPSELPCPPRPVSAVSLNILA